MINYDGKRFRPVTTDSVEAQRVAIYRQEGNLIWGEFHGGRARRGTLAGICGPSGALDFAYCMVLESGEVISGRCASTPRILDDGRIQLDEEWERYGPHTSKGLSRLEEIMETT